MTIRTIPDEVSTASSLDTLDPVVGGTVPADFEMWARMISGSGESDQNRLVAGDVLAEMIVPIVVTQAEAMAGTSTEERIWTPERIADAIDALAIGKAGVPSATQVATWQSSDDVEGSISLTFDGATFTVDGDISVTGTVDGRDLSADGILLDAIEAGADVTDATNVAAAGAVMESDTTTALMGFVVDEDGLDSDLATKVPTQQSVKAYVDATTAAALTWKGGYDAATNTPDLDTSPSGVSEGDQYAVTVAGNFFTAAVAIGDTLIADTDNATVEGDWTIILRSLDQATTTTTGIVELATTAEVDTGTDTDRAVTPVALASSALQTKVDGIEALADVTDTANVTTAGALMDSEVDADIKTLVLPASTTISAFGATLVDDADAATARATLGGIEAGATADQTGAEIKTAYELEADTNAFTDAEQTKLAAIESLATADQTGAEIKVSYEAEADTNAFTDDEKTRVAGANIYKASVANVAALVAVESTDDNNNIRYVDSTCLYWLRSGGAYAPIMPRISQAADGDAQTTNGFPDQPGYTDTSTSGGTQWHFNDTEKRTYFWNGTAWE